MKLKISAYFIVLFFLCLQCVFAAADTTVIKSPNGTISFKLFQRIQQLYFAVTLFDKPIVDSSPIGFLVDGVSLTKKYQDRENRTLQRQ